MRSRSLLVLTIIALLAVGAAVWLSAERKAEPARAGGELLFPGLTERLNEVEAVHVADSEADVSVTLERTDAGWGIAERAGYPANLQDLRRQLIALAESRLLEPKTANPANYDALGVEDPDSEGAGSRLVRLELPGESLELIVGDTSFRGSTMTYVRRPGEARSWGASGNLAMEADPQDWLDKSIIDIPVGEVRRVELVHPDGDRVEIVKNDRANPNFTVSNVPEARSTLSPSAGNSIGGALGSLTMEDVTSAQAFDPEGKEPVRGVFETFDGLRVETRAWQLDDERYLALSVAHDPSLVQNQTSTGAEDGSALAGSEFEEESGDQTEEAVEAATDGDEADDTDAGADAGTDAGDSGEAEASPDAQERAAALQQALEGWVFKIPSYKHSNLTKRMEDLLKPAEEADSDQEK